MKHGTLFTPTNPPACYLPVLNDNISAIRQQLRDGIVKGYWTLEQLDTPSAGWLFNERTDRRTFPEGYVGIEHRNLLRDDEPQERVEAEPSPRDFTPAAPHDRIPIVEPSDPFDF